MTKLTHLKRVVLAMALAPAFMLTGCPHRHHDRYPPPPPPHDHDHDHDDHDHGPPPHYH